MIYKIDNKYFVRVQGYFKEIEIEFDAYDNPSIKIKPNGKKLEVNNVNTWLTVNLEYIKANIKSETISNDDKKTYRNYTNR